jgi:hypothetical protein
LGRRVRCIGRGRVPEREEGSLGHGHCTGNSGPFVNLYNIIHGFLRIVYSPQFHSYQVILIWQLLVLVANVIGWYLS